MDERERMCELVRLLDEAAHAYYQEDREILSNKDYDALYDELLALEAETGIVMSQSPTQKVGYEIVSALPKETHESPMLSLDKTKEPEALREWLGEQEGLLSWKMDGLTVVLTYRDGRLFKAVTRGNGTEGEVITNNARVFQNVPAKIPFTGELILRGEAVIKYSDFARINAGIADVDARYKNPRNLCSGSVRQLNNEVTAQRNVFFFAFALVRAAGREIGNSVEAAMRFVEDLGFSIVPYAHVNRENILEEVQAFSGKIADNDFPSDGLVLIYDDIAYGESLGRTAKFPRNAIAFKWADEEAETELVSIEWSPSRTGLINPIAVFAPVELEGTTVSRASLHNISIMESLALGEGDTIKVYKANMIIPQISENLTRSGTFTPPAHCPVCGAQTELRKEGEVKTLYCPNPYCSAKKVKLFAHYASRDALNIEGLSEATLEKLIDAELLAELDDLYALGKHRETIVALEGFQERSCENLLASIERTRHTTLARFVYGLGIPNVGSVNAKLLCRHFGQSLAALASASAEEMTEVDGIGPVIAESVRSYFDAPHNRALVERLLTHLTFEEEAAETGEPISQIAGKTFVITGSVTHYKNRAELKAHIERLGGKVTGSVSKKTDYLLNNDSTSTSGKNKKAKELGIPILTEEAFLAMLEAE